MTSKPLEEHLGGLRLLEESTVGAHHHPHKVGRRGELRGAVVRQGGSRRLVRSCVSASCSGAASTTEAFETRTSPADSNGVEALGGFSMKLGAALSIVGGSVITTLFLLQINPSSVASSVSLSDTTLGAFLLAFLRGSFLRWGAGRATAAGGPAGGDWPWAAAIYATKFGTVWEPTASLWDLAMARSPAILSFHNIISALLAHSYQTAQKFSV